MYLCCIDTWLPAVHDGFRSDTGELYVKLCFVVKCFAVLNDVLCCAEWCAVLFCAVLSAMLCCVECCVL